MTRDSAMCSNTCGVSDTMTHLATDRYVYRCQGNISIHQNIGYIVIEAEYRWGLSGNVAIVLATIVAIALASFLSFAIERPANRLIRRRYKAWKTGRKTSLSFAG